MHNADGVSVRNTDDAPEQSAARIVMFEATWQALFKSHDFQRINSQGAERISAPSRSCQNAD
jgi:hypothetical protein